MRPGRRPHPDRRGRHRASSPDRSRVTTSVVRSARAAARSPAAGEPGRWLGPTPPPPRSMAPVPGPAAPTLFVGPSSRSPQSRFGSVTCCGRDNQRAVTAVTLRLRVDRAALVPILLRSRGHPPVGLDRIASPRRCSWPSGGETSWQTGTTRPCRRSARQKGRLGWPRAPPRNHSARATRPFRAVRASPLRETVPLPCGEPILLHVLANPEAPPGPYPPPRPRPTGGRSRGAVLRRSRTRPARPPLRLGTRITSGRVGDAGPRRSLRRGLGGERAVRSCPNTIQGPPRLQAGARSLSPPCRRRNPDDHPGRHAQPRGEHDRLRCGTRRGGHATTAAVP